MDLVTIKEIRQARQDGSGPIDWREGDAWLAGTWLFSEPQPHLRRLVDLEKIRRKLLGVTKEGLEIAATCTIAELHRLCRPEDWVAAPLIHQCCRSSGHSTIKIWNTATVGGNICMSLPAGPMISLTVALEGTCVIRSATIPSECRIAIENFVTGNHQQRDRTRRSVARIDLPGLGDAQAHRFRRLTLTHLGRSTALIIGTLSSARRNLHADGFRPQPHDRID